MTTVRGSAACVAASLWLVGCASSATPARPALATPTPAVQATPAPSVITTAKPPAAVPTEPPATGGPAPYPPPLRYVAELSRELAALADARREGTITDAELGHARLHVINRIVGFPNGVGDAIWLRDELRQLLALRSDGQLSDAEYLRARAIFVLPYQR